MNATDRKRAAERLALESYGARGRETRHWSKGSARGAGPQKKSGTVQVNFNLRAEDVPQCLHGVPCRRCDDCGAFIAGHPGQPAHRCNEVQASCVDEQPRTEDGRVRR